jgi:hypothetical protein
MALIGNYAELKKHGFPDQHTPVLDHHSICVIKGHNHQDLEKAYHAGFHAGNGTEEERIRYRQIFDTWDQNNLDLQRDLLTLSDRSHFIVAARGRHNVHRSDVIFVDIKWVLVNIEK